MLKNSVKIFYNKRLLHISLPQLHKDVYNPFPEYKEPSLLQKIKGLKQFPEELKKLKEETQNLFRNCNDHFQDSHGKTEVLFDFKDEDSLSKWITKSDIDFDLGNSMCNLSMTKNKTGLFTGYINSALPQDGRVKYTGFCSMKSMRRLKAFYKKDPYYIGESTHIALRVRGDGRKYSFVVNTPGIFDLTYYDQYIYPIYTRGGPYWQTVLIPFSKLVLSSKGRIQDQQSRINDFYVDSFGINIYDGNDGPFSLEIDYLAFFNDAYHREHFAYELYRVPTGVKS
ncbi:unnamed protein product [Gordionus sp. m RMFG-2023]|uniref:complex I intermediate-associated protein 30, mitochondrial-like n=1 Tax=Gordionus sp. m RMFG-2023 TaxID=3053472 RepID=UPI0030E0C9D4